MLLQNSFDFTLLLSQCVALYSISQGNALLKAVTLRSSVIVVSDIQRRLKYIYFFFFFNVSLTLWLSWLWELSKERISIRWSISPAGWPNCVKSHASLMVLLIPAGQWIMKMNQKYNGDFFSSCSSHKQLWTPGSYSFNT